MQKYKIQNCDLVDVDKLIPNPKNPNNHPDKQIDMLAKILDFQGQRLPIVVSNRSGFIVAGHGRLEAIKKLGWDKAAVSYQDFDNEAQEYAHMIADNKIAELAKHDDSMMIDEIKELGIDDFELLGLEDFDLPLEVDPAKEEIEDDVPTDVETRCKPGDLWILGEHRLLCGDSTNIQHVERLMGGEKADMVFTDPPYGINVVNVGTSTVGGSKAFGTDGAKNGTCKRIIKANEYKPIIGDESGTTAKDVYAICESLNIKQMVFWGANYYASSLPDNKKWIVWDKETTGNFSECELAWTNVEGRIQRFKHVWNGLIKESEKRDKRVHPTQKPIALAEWTFDALKAGKFVLDLFGGSGSTLIACEKTNRKCFMMELDPHYCDVILSRWEKYSGKEAVISSESAKEGDHG